MIVIIEGQDRTGKDTQTELLRQKYKHLSFHKLHYSTPPTKTIDTSIDYSSKLYDGMFKMIHSASETDQSLLINRAHLGESVYSPLYRGYSGDYIFDIEKKYLETLTDDLFLIVLVNDPHFVMSRDDGDSHHKNSEERIAKERDMFTRACMKSGITNKLLINCKDSTPDMIHHEITKFIEDTNQSRFISHDQIQIQFQ